MTKKVNGPIAALDAVQPAEVSETLNLLERFRVLPKVTNDDELEARIDLFFRLCAETGTRPGIELLALCLHTTRQSIYYWSVGQKCTERRHELISQARQTISAYLEQLGAQNKINAITLLFWQKNHFSYKDSTTLELSRPSDALLTVEQSPEEIAAAIEADIPLDD